MRQFPRSGQQKRRDQDAMRNLKVLARDPEDGFYHLAYMTGPGKHRYRKASYNVRFLAKEGQYQVDDIIYIGGAVPWPELLLGDFVLVPCTKPERNGGKSTRQWLPGQVVKLPFDPVHEHRFYNVRLFDGKMIEKRRKEIVKIATEKFEAVVTDILRQKHGDKNATFYYHEMPFRRTEAISNVSHALLDKIELTKPAEPGKAEIIGGLAIGTEVLACYPDDGWFYFGVVKSRTTEKINYYDILDSTGHVTSIFREDILTDDLEPFHSIQPQNCVVALHPSYIFSYAPAVVLAAYEKGAEVEFYDTCRRMLMRSDMYKITRPKYEKYVERIRQSEETLNQQEAIVLDNKSGYFTLRKIESPIEKQKFLVSTLNENENKPEYLEQQKAIHIFPLTENYKIRKAQSVRYVLAPVDELCQTYLPAEITFDKESDDLTKLPVRFCDNKTSVVTREKCFYLSSYYFNFAVQLFNMLEETAKST